MSFIGPKVSLAEVANIIRGVSFNRDEGTKNPGQGMLPVLRAGNIQESLNTEHDLVWVPENRFTSKQIIKKNDIVMCTSSGSADIVGKCARANNNWHGSFGAFCVGIRANQKVCNPSYLFHFLRSPNFTNWTKQSSGINIKNIRKSELENFQVPLPPLPEQRRIAAILDKADAIRCKRQRAIELTEDFLRSAFLEMFGDPVTNPKGWDVKPLGEMLSFLTSGSRGWAKYYAEQGDIFLRIQNVSKNKLILDDLSYVIAPDSAESRRTTVQPISLPITRILHSALGLQGQDEITATL